MLSGRAVSRETSTRRAEDLVPVATSTPQAGPLPDSSLSARGFRFTEKSPIGPRLGQVSSLDQSATVWAGSHSPEGVRPLPERGESVGGAATDRWLLIVQGGG